MITSAGIAAPRLQTRKPVSAVYGTAHPGDHLDLLHKWNKMAVKFQLNARQCTWWTQIT